MDLRAGDAGGGFFDGKGQRDAAITEADQNIFAVVGDQVADLRFVIVGKDVRAGDRGAVIAGVEQRAERQARVGLHVVGTNGDADVGIARLSQGGFVGGGAVERAGEFAADNVEAALVDLSNALGGKARVIEGFEFAHAAMAGGGDCRIAKGLDVIHGGHSRLKCRSG